MGDMSRRDVESALCRKGLRESGGRHRRFVFYTRDNKKTSVWTHTSHGSKHRDLSVSILGKMAGQCRLTNDQFRTSIECPMSREDYEKILRESGHVKG